jgi:hypothetical protein
MRIREKKTQSYDRFRYLLEFQFKKQPKLDEQDEEPTSSDNVFDEISGVMDGQNPEEMPTSEIPQEIENEIPDDVTQAISIQ